MQVTTYSWRSGRCPAPTQQAVARWRPQLGLNCHVVPAIQPIISIIRASYSPDRRSPNARARQYKCSCRTFAAGRRSPIAFTTPALWLVHGFSMRRGCPRIPINCAYLRFGPVVAERLLASGESAISQFCANQDCSAASNALSWA